MKTLGSRLVLTLAGIALATLTGAPAQAGEETSGLFVEFTATRAQEEIPGELRTKEMCPDRPGTHTFAPDLRIADRDELVITDRFIGFEFTMTLTRSGQQPTLVKTAQFRVTRTGTRPIAGGAARINFSLQPGDCVRLTFAPRTNQLLLAAEVLTASLFLTKEPAASPSGPPPPPAASCTIDFDTACPSNTSAVCGATFRGGDCVTIGVGSCYSTGRFSYQVTDGQPVTIELDAGLNALDLFFATNGSGQGTMTFFDANGNQVGSPLQTNGDCRASMPPTHRLSFATPVRSIEVTTAGDSFIDTFVVNPR